MGHRKNLQALKRKNKRIRNQKKTDGFYRKIKNVIPLSDYYFQIKRKAIIAIINEEDEEPTKFATTNERLKLKTYGFMKWGGT